jgi:hypothetical protein
MSDIKRRISRLEKLAEESEIKKRCDSILKDRRLELLITQKEFYGIKAKLKKVNVTNNYLDYVETHINKIDQHYKIITVNGEDVPVRFVTKGE